MRALHTGKAPPVVPQSVDFSQIWLGLFDSSSIKFWLIDFDAESGSGSGSAALRRFCGVRSARCCAGIPPAPSLPVPPHFKRLLFDWIHKKKKRKKNLIIDYWCSGSQRNQQIIEGTRRFCCLCCCITSYACACLLLKIWTKMRSFIGELLHIESMKSPTKTLKRVKLDEKPKKNRKNEKKREEEEFFEHFYLKRTIFNYLTRRKWPRAHEGWVCPCGNTLLLESPRSRVCVRVLRSSPFSCAYCPRLSSWKLWEKKSV